MVTLQLANHTDRLIKLLVARLLLVLFPLVNLDVQKGWAVVVCQLQTLTSQNLHMQLHTALR